MGRAVPIRILVAWVCFRLQGCVEYRSCDEYLTWPDHDNVDCGGCRGVVNIKEGETCAKYCASFGHACFSALRSSAARNKLTCDGSTTSSLHECSYAFGGVSDLLCGCETPPGSTPGLSWHQPT